MDINNDIIFTLFIYISSSSPTPIKSPIVHHVPPISTIPYTLPLPR